MIDIAMYARTTLTIYNFDVSFNFKWAYTLGVFEYIFLNSCNDNKITKPKASITTVVLYPQLHTSENIQRLGSVMYPGADDGYRICLVETFCYRYKKRDEVVHRENKIRRIYGQRWRKYI